MSDTPAKPELSATLKALLSRESWFLKVNWWQQHIQGINKSGEGHQLARDHRIQLRCRLQRGLLQGDLLVGEDLAQNLADLPFDIELFSDRIFADFGAENEVPGEHGMGVLNYSPPMELDMRGSVSGWAAFTDDALREIGGLLHTPREFYLSISLGASDIDEPGLLTYEPKQSFEPTTYRWSGKHTLVIREIEFVNRSPEPDEPRPDDKKGQPVDIISLVERATGSLKMTITSMGTSILILLMVILIAIWRSHI